jgi:GH18 family chitinase
MRDTVPAQIKRLVGYFPTGAIHAQDYHVTYIPASLLSRVIYAFANVTAAGDCVSVNAARRHPRDWKRRPQLAMIL